MVGRLISYILVLIFGVGPFLQHRQPHQYSHLKATSQQENVRFFTLFDSEQLPDSFLFEEKKEEEKEEEEQEKDQDSKDKELARSFASLHQVTLHALTLSISQPKRLGSISFTLRMERGPPA